MNISSKINFKHLEETDFPLLLKWLSAPHVKKWWDHNINWTIDLIKEKYSNYTKGYKLINSGDFVGRKAIYPFIILMNNQSIGYVQYYSAYDFDSNISKLNKLPESLAQLDIFIGEEKWVGKKIGSTILKLFLKFHIFLNFENCLVEADATNLQAIKAFEKSGFTIIQGSSEVRQVTMIAKKPKIQ